MKFKSAIITQASGSIGGATYAHNQGGLYIRARSIPTNPNTTPQQAARNAFGSLAMAWRETLTSAQRSAWEAYAANTPVTNSLGDSILLSGQQMFIRNNGARVRAGEALVAASPVGGGGTALTTPTFDTFTDGDGFGDVAYTNTDDWATAVGGFLIIQMSRQQNASINFFAGPFCYAATVDGAVVAPTSPVTVTSPFGETFSTGKRVYLRCIACSADGRISDAKIISGLVTA